MRKLAFFLSVFASLAPPIAAQTLPYKPTRMKLVLSTTGDPPYTPLTTASGQRQFDYSNLDYIVPMCSSTAGPPYSQCRFSSGGRGTDIISRLVDGGNLFSATPGTPEGMNSGATAQGLQETPVARSATPRGAEQHNNATAFGATATIFIAPSGDTTGATDNAAIQAAVTAGKAIHLDPGTYYISGISITAPARIDCSGAGSTILNMVSTTNNFFTVRYGGGQLNSESNGAGIYNCGFQYKSGVTPTAGDALNISGNIRYLSGFHFEGNQMWGLWGGIRTGNLLINDWFTNNMMTNFLSGGDGCIYYNTSSPGGDLFFDGDQCIGNQYTNVTIARADTMEFTNLKVNLSHVIFTGAGPTFRVRFVNPSLEAQGASPTIACNVDFGTGANKPTLIQFIGGEFAGATNPFCNASGVANQYSFVGEWPSNGGNEQTVGLGAAFTNTIPTAVTTGFYAGISSSLPAWRLYDSAGGTDSKWYGAYADTSCIYEQFQNDARNVANTYQSACRGIGYSPSTQNFYSPTIKFSGTSTFLMTANAALSAVFKSSAGNVVIGNDRANSSSFGDIDFKTNGTENWFLGQNANTAFSLYDVAARHTTFSIAQGAPSAAFSMSSGGLITVNSIVAQSSRKGTFVCTSGGTIAISNTNEAPTSDVIISLNTVRGTISTAPAMKTVTAGKGFTVLCATSDTSTYNYDILN